MSLFPTRKMQRLRLSLFMGILVGAAVFVPGCGKKSDLPNVILICIDTLRPDHLGCYGYERRTSATIDSLANAGTLFEHVTTQSPWTLPSHVTLFSATHPFTHGVVDDNCRIPSDLPMMAEVMKSHGYRCAGFVSSFYVGRTFGFERGFDEFEDFGTDEHQQVFPGGKVLGEDVTGRGLRWLSRDGEPFFLFLHYYDAHVNYIVPKPYRSLFEEPYGGAEILYQSYEHYLDHPFSAREQEHLLAQYDAAITYVDANIRRVLNHLQENNLTDRTLVVITSDHGEEFFERGSWGHGHTLYREVLDIPLILVDPRRRGGALRISQAARLIDVFPTLLDALALPTPDGIQGESLWPYVEGSPSNEDNPDLSETSRHNQNLVSLRRGPLKLISDLREEQHLIFNLEEDPGEQANHAAPDTALTRAVLEETLRMSADLIPSRLCLRWDTGAEPCRYSGKLTTVAAVIETDYRPEDAVVDVSRDRRTVTFSSDSSGELRIAVLPVDASVLLELRIDGVSDTKKIFVGGNAIQPVDMPLVFSGVVRSLEFLRPPPDRGPGFYVWKDPGDRTAAEPVDLSEEAKEHLKSLGYLH